MRVLLVPLLAVASCLGQTFATQEIPRGWRRNVIVGTGDPNIDVPAVQAAVDRGGSVMLKGRFSFDRPPTKWVEASNGRTVLVSKEVVVSGTLDENGAMTTITGGTNPFAVEAPGAHVTIRGLRFLRPKEQAIMVRAVNGLVISSCRIEGLEPLPNPTARGGNRYGSGIYVGTTPTLFPPTVHQPGRPENVAGTLLIINNEIDVAGLAGTNTLGITIFGAGRSPDKEVDLYVSGNRIRNVTVVAVNTQQIRGRVWIDRNIILTGLIAGNAAAPHPDVINAVGSGSYVIAHNSIDCAWPSGAAIRVRGEFPEWQMAGAIIVDNDITMSAPLDTVFGTNSAAIEIRGFALGNVVLNNRIRGRARSSLAVVSHHMGVPGNNMLVLNDMQSFQPSFAGIFVDAGVTNTLIVGRKGTVMDRGTGTVITDAVAAALPPRAGVRVQHRPQ